MGPLLASGHYCISVIRVVVCSWGAIYWHVAAAIGNFHKKVNGLVARTKNMSVVKSKDVVAVESLTITTRKTGLFLQVIFLITKNWITG